MGVSRYTELTSARTARTELHQICCDSRGDLGSQELASVHVNNKAGKNSRQFTAASCPARLRGRISYAQWVTCLIAALNASPSTQVASFGGLGTVSPRCLGRSDVDALAVRSHGGKCDCGRRVWSRQSATRSLVCGSACTRHTTCPASECVWRIKCFADDRMCRGWSHCASHAVT